MLFYKIDHGLKITWRPALCSENGELLSVHGLHVNCRKPSGSDAKKDDAPARSAKIDNLLKIRSNGAVKNDIEAYWDCFLQLVGPILFAVVCKQFHAESFAWRIFSSELLVPRTRAPTAFANKIAN